MGEITSKNEGCGFPWYKVDMWASNQFWIGVVLHPLPRLMISSTKNSRPFLEE